MTPKPNPETTRVIIVGDHPWANHTGILHSEGGKVKVIRPLGRGEEMVAVELDNGHRCCAAKHNLRLIPSERKPFAG